MWFLNSFSLILLLSAANGSIIDDLLARKSGFKITTVENRTISIEAPDPPPIDQAARMARYIVAQSDWCSRSHISLQPETNGFPMARVFSVSDGPVGSSSGIPYTYTSLMDEGTRDVLASGGKCSLTMTLAQGQYCNSKNLDMEDPRCPQVILTGILSLIPNNTQEWDTAANAIFSRHPRMKDFPSSHHFHFAKLTIQNILLVDNIGGNKYPSVDDYFKATPPQKWGPHRGKLLTISDSAYQVINVV